MMSTILHVLKEYLEFLKRISIIGQIPLKYSLLLVHVWYDSLTYLILVCNSQLRLLSSPLSGYGTAQTTYIIYIYPHFFLRYITELKRH